MSEVKIDFSVLVLCYNPNLQDLFDTLKSIQNQESVIFETIICDDGSKDDYKESLNQWLLANNYKNVTLCFSSQNQGTIKNYLNGLRVAKGTFVKPISPGDCLANNKVLRTYLDNFDKTHHILFSDSKYYSINSFLKKKQYPITYKIFNEKKINKLYSIYKIFFLGATIASRRELTINTLEKIEGKVLYLEDYSLIMLSILNGENIRGIKSELIIYQYGTGISTKSKTNTRIERDACKLEEYIYENYKYSDLASEIKFRRSIDQFPFLKKLTYLIIFYPKTFYFYLLRKLRCL